MFSESELLPISALQHLAFCQRQWGLMYLENIWDENPLTAEGRLLHERTDEAETEARGNIRIARGLRLRSLRLGLTGRADVVEFRLLPEVLPDPDSQSILKAGLRLEDVPGLWQPLPVEYKRGKPKPDRCDEIQLCAQALCLEEMLTVRVPKGAIFYGQPRRRSEVSIDGTLRDETEKLATLLHQLTSEAITPSARYEKKCRSCSILSFCMPKAATKSSRRYLDRAITETDDEGGHPAARMGGAP